MASEEISSLKHEAFRLAESLTKPAARSLHSLYLVETSNFVRQALAAPCGVRTVFAIPEEAIALRPLCAERGVSLYGIRPGLLQKLTGAGYDTAVTAIAIVERRTVAPEALDLSGDALFLAGESIQDPRNVGVLIRTAEAVGCRALLLSSNSAEPFSRAAVRSTTGSILRLPLCLCDSLPEALAGLRRRGAEIVATSARASRFAFEAPLYRRPLVLTVGNETEGISEETRLAASDFVALPMAPNGASSLNVTVAAGALLFEADRQRRCLGRNAGEDALAKE